MKTYAIKTEKGYLARQGNYNWFEEKPVGWALFCKEDDARNIAIAQCEIKFEIVEIS
jgi:hypothetical protein